MNILFSAPGTAGGTLAVPFLFGLIMLKYGRMQSSFVQLDTQIWKEGDMYVAHVPLLQLSSCGYTVEEARKNIKEVTEIFFEETDRKGTTKDVLEELGFEFDKEWKPPEIIEHQKMSVAI